MCSGQNPTIYEEAYVKWCQFVLFHMGDVGNKTASDLKNSEIIQEQTT